MIGSFGSAAPPADSAQMAPLRSDFLSAQSELRRAGDAADKRELRFKIKELRRRMKALDRGAPKR